MPINKFYFNNNYMMSYVDIKPKICATKLDLSNGWKNLLNRKKILFNLMKIQLNIGYNK